MKTLICLVGVAAAVTACDPPVPVVTELGTEATPRSTGLATAINDGGRIVGSYGEPNQAAEFRDDGSVVLLPIPTGYVSCQAMGIAGDGTIAGDCSVPDLNIRRIVTWDSAGVAHPLLDLPPGASNRAMDMNRHGVILEEQSGGPDAGYWTHDLRTGKRTKIAFEDGVHGRALGINDTGDIVGFIGNTLGERKAVKWSGDPLVATVLAIPPDCRGKAHDVNNRGVIVGTTVCVQTRIEQLAVWSSATALPEALPPPRTLPGFDVFEMSEADINDDGIVIASGMQLGRDAMMLVGAAWTADRRLIDLGFVIPTAINAAGVIVGGYQYPSAQPVRVELVRAR